MIRKTNAERYIHFKERLKKHYNMDITEEQFFSLHPKKYLQKTGSKSNLVFINFSDVEILAIWSKDFKCCRTCLQKDDACLVKPKFLRNKETEYDRDGLRDFINEKIKIAESLRLLNLTKKELFTQHPIKLAKLYSFLEKRDKNQNNENKMEYHHLLNRIVLTIFKEEIEEKFINLHKTYE